MPPPAGWGKIKDLVIQASKINATLTDFTVTLDAAALPPDMIDSSSPTHALNGGGDIRFFLNSDGTNQLPCVVHQFVLDGDAQIKFKVPSASPITNTTVYIAWNNPSATHEPRSSAFGEENTMDSNYAFVHPMEDDPDVGGATIIDSTSNLNDGTGYNDLDQVVGKMGNAISVLGPTYGWYDLGNDSSLQFVDGITVSCWIKTNLVRTGYVIARDDQSSNRAWVLYLSNNYVQFYVWNASTYKVVSSLAAIPIDEWVHIVGTYDQTNLSVYVNGANKSNVTTLTGPIKSTTINCSFFNRHDGAGGGGVRLTSYVDAVKLSSVARTEEWINAEYENQNDPSTFVLLGSGDLTPPTITAQNPANNDTGVAINSSVYFELDDDSSGVDSSTINVTIEGVSAITNGVFQSDFSGTITADGLGYDVTINHTADWSYDQVINIVVDCDDIDGNSMIQEIYSFTCVSEPASGGAGNGFLSPDILARTKKKFLLPDIMIN